MKNRTSLQWWEHVLANPEELIVWLQKQYHGEVTAAQRIRTFATLHCTDAWNARTLELIAHQEETHAEWVASLLTARGITPAVLEKVERYWNETLPGIVDFHSGAAVASHAEHMRLDRIRVIGEHADTPDDIRAVFLRILPQEEFHERAFAEMAGVEALADALGKHEQGLEALGLVA
jgi:rubrerythrin